MKQSSRKGSPRCIDMGGGCGGSARPVPLQVPCDTKKAMLSLVCRSGLLCWAGTLVCHACLPCWSAVLMSVGGGFMDMGGGCGGPARPVPLQVPCDTKKAMLGLVCRSGLPRWLGTLVCRACLPRTTACALRYEEGYVEFGLSFWFATLAWHAGLPCLSAVLVYRVGVPRLFVLGFGFICDL